MEPQKSGASSKGKAPASRSSGCEIHKKGRKSQGVHTLLDSGKAVSRVLEGESPAKGEPFREGGTGFYTEKKGILSSTTTFSSSKKTLRPRKKREPRPLPSEEKDLVTLSL